MPKRTGYEEAQEKVVTKEFCLVNKIMTIIEEREHYRRILKKYFIDNGYKGIIFQAVK